MEHLGRNIHLEIKNTVKGMCRIAFVKILFFFILFCTFPGCTQAKNTTDSLFTLLRSNPEDSTKIDLYLSLYKAFYTKDLEKSRGFVEKAVLLSEKIGDKKRECASLIKLANIHLYKGNLSEVNTFLGKAEKNFSYFKDPAIEGDLYLRKGILENMKSNHEDAIENLLKACTRFEILGDSASIASCYNNIGTTYLEIGQYDKSVEFYQKGLKIFEKIGDERRRGHALGNLGIVYKRQKNYDKALEFYNKSLEINERNGYMMDVRMDLNNIGVLYQDLGKYEKALECHRKAKEIADSLDVPLYILTSNVNLAFVETELGQYNKVINDLTETIEKAKKENFKAIIKSSYQILSDAYEKSGDLSKALTFRKEYEIWKDSLLNESHLNQVKELELKYETEKKDKQIVLLAKEKEIQEKETIRQATLKKSFIGGFMSVVALGGLIIFSMRQRLKNQKLLAAKNEEIKSVNFKRQLSELELKALRAQINPHFLFNCMNSINRMILANETENASRYLTKFSKLVRLILENSEETTVSLENELTMLEAYIQLEALRFKGKIIYEIIVEKEIERESTYIPSMVLQPFVENAIWHGLIHKGREENGKISILIREEGNHLVCIIEDNGVGREKARNLHEKSILKSKSLGIKITEERLRLLSKERLEQLIKISDLKDVMDFAVGTRVEINVSVS